MEVLLAQESSLSDKHQQLLLYSAGRNGNINKYNRLLTRKYTDNNIGSLAFLLFVHDHLTVEQKLAVLENMESTDAFLQQEILTAQTELYLEAGNIDRAEKSLLMAYGQNNYAFAPALGRFYATYRGFGKALSVFESHLAVYHDQSVALQAAELYCLLKQNGKIAQLRNDYQSDSGNRAMLCNYYFDALIALAERDTAKLQTLIQPLRGNIDTPLSAFMFLCAAVQSGSFNEVKSRYETLLAHQNYLNLQEQADNMLSEFLKSAVSKKNIPQENLLQLAAVLHNRKPDAFTAKFILLTQKRTNTTNIVLLKDALKRFGGDPGIIKIAIEYYLLHSLDEAERLIAYYKQNFAPNAGDMVRYEIFLNMQKKDYEKVSILFRNNFAEDLLPEYWNFASTTKREVDLLFLSRDKIYEPFCQALIHLKKNEVAKACELLEKADAKNNYALLFFAAKTLAENGRNQAALNKYELFPERSSYAVAVLLNMAELYAETGNIDQALILSARAYNLDPQLPETQLCYADKLHKKGDLRTIPDVVKLSPSSSFRRRMEPLWIIGMEQRIKDCNINTQREKMRELCRQLLVISPDNNIALEYLKKLHQMPQ